MTRNLTLGTLPSAVIFRDLKPQNIGFDVKGTVKIFDFGVARDLVYVKEVKDRLGFTGTPRYMANEVGTGNEYGLSADVYSFGILLHEICTLKEPFSNLRNIDAFRKKVAHGGERPKLSSIRHSGLRSLMERCWDPLPEGRPSFTEVRQELENIVGKPQVDVEQPSLLVVSSKGNESLFRTVFSITKGEFDECFQQEPFHHHTAVRSVEYPSERTSCL